MLLLYTVSTLVSFYQLILSNNLSLQYLRGGLLLLTLLTIVEIDFLEIEFSSDICDGLAMSFDTGGILKPIKLALFVGRLWTMSKFSVTEDLTLFLCNWSRCFFLVFYHWL